VFVLSNAKCRSESRDRLIGTAAADATDRIIYNATTGALLYGSNGSAAGGSVQIATLATGLAMTNNDFLII
jgi:Ca2+-binding RTX toxin-like protein